jgi:hypothetical protein
MQEFHTIAPKLHHLLSTSSRTGIYGSTAGKEFAVTAYEQPLEDHIRALARTQYDDFVQNDHDSVKNG